MGNRIVLASTITPDDYYPADAAGLESGDRIVAINGVPIATYSDIQENIALNPDKKLSMKVERNGTIQELSIRPSMDKSTGAGKIGVYFWADPVIQDITVSGPADNAGLKSGDRILTANGAAILYSVAFISLLEHTPQSLSIEFERNEQIMHTTLTPVYTETGADLGMNFQSLQYHTPRLSPIGSIAKGGQETWKILVVSIKSFALLFKGIDLTQAVSGPVRITYMLGDVAATGFNQNIGSGIRNMAEFLTLISIALCVMNLLPLPVLDGGLILLFIIEIIKQKPLNPRAISIFQTVGVVLIFGLMIFAVFGDVLYLIRL
jgi:regulator of sigma E protease